MLNEIMEKYKDADLSLNQEKLLEAPQCGYILIYFQTGMEFGTYQKVTCIRDGVKTADIQSACLDLEKYKDGAKLLELHLFDQKKEYRAVYKQSGAFLENIISDETVERTVSGRELEGLDTQKVEYQLLYGSSYEYSAERGGILAAQDGNKKFFYLPDPKGADLYLKIVNYIDYDEDMLVIANYRLAGIYMPTENKEREWKYLWP